MVNKSPNCSAWMQSQKRQNDLCSFPRQTIQYHSNPSLCPNSNAEEAEVEWFYEDLQDLFELTPKKEAVAAWAQEAQKGPLNVQEQKTRPH